MNILNSHLVVAESDGEPPIVAVHNLNAVVSRAAGQSYDNKINRNCLILGRFFIWDIFGYHSSSNIYLTGIFQIFQTIL